MTLAEHLAGLRSRLLKALAAIAVGTGVGWMAYDPAFVALQRPFEQIRDERGLASSVALNFTGVVDPFSLKIKIALYLGLLIASPVWIYQLWAFITPGLHRHERRYALGFLAAAVPLFLAGCYLAWLVMPNAVSFLLEFTPPGAANIVDLQTYIGFVLQLVLAFGLAFLFPVALVGVNFTGLVSARTLTRSWRVTVFLIFVFAAMFTPTPDAWTMLALGLGIVLLYVAALGVCWVHDGRVARRAAQDPAAGWQDSQASPLDDPGGPQDEPTHR
jgi:sec-independent protein translocase protein TatC